MCEVSSEVEIGVRELRLRFNEAGYFQKMLDRELLELPKEGRPAGPCSGEPPGTVSRMVYYRRPHGCLVAKCHRYDRPDGTIGGSGFDDPKWVQIDSIVYWARSLGGTRRPRCRRRQH